ncbi:MAG: hypothetical protein EOO23_06565 [Comamonadaceae bacterium]|nr:MAG: hypothetical protein EOO23_06565 [Comamonadaceae bacterium]
MSAASKPITGKVGVWVLSCITGPQDLVGQPSETVMPRLHFSSVDMGDSWTKVGEADVTVSLFSEKAMVEHQVATIRKAIVRVKADAQKQATELNQQLQSLLAIEAQP